MRSRPYCIYQNTALWVAILNNASLIWETWPRDSTHSPAVCYFTECWLFNNVNVFIFVSLGASYHLGLLFMCHLLSTCGLTIICSDLFVLKPILLDCFSDLLHLLFFIYGTDLEERTDHYRQSFDSKLYGPYDAKVNVGSALSLSPVCIKRSVSCYFTLRLWVVIAL